MPIQALTSQRLYQKAADQIRELIRAGELRPGSRLPPERDLAKQLGVSRPTVREAMIALEIAGLVEIRVGSGIYVTALARSGSRTLLSQTDAGPSPFELLAARLTLEGEIAAQAAEAASAEDLQAIEATIQGMRDDLARGDTGQDNDRLFHARIAGTTSNSVLVSMVQELWEGMFAPIFHTLSAHTGLPDNLRMTLTDHERIYEAIRNRDAAEARSAMHAHLRHVEQVLQGADDLAQLDAARLRPAAR